MDLYELHRLYAALVNNHMHHDLKRISEVERQTAMADILEQIEDLMQFKTYPFEVALAKAVAK